MAEQQPKYVSPVKQAERALEEIERYAVTDVWSGMMARAIIVFFKTTHSYTLDGGRRVSRTDATIERARREFFSDSAYREHRDEIDAGIGPARTALRKAREELLAQL